MAQTLANAVVEEKAWQPSLYAKLLKLLQTDGEHTVRDFRISRKDLKRAEREMLAWGMLDFKEKKGRKKIL